MKTIRKLPPDAVSRCEKFALDSVDTHLTHYKKRGQKNRDKIIQDITVGKMGEMGLYLYLSTSLIGQPTEPDFEIYRGRRKKFSSDMIFNTIDTEYNIHIKSQSKESADKYGDSWLFQWNGMGYGHTDKIFKSYEDTDLFAATKIDKDEVIIQGIWKLKDIFDNELFKEPRLKWFVNSKRALYLKDIEGANIYNLLEFLMLAKDI